jgi:hypothetical protein
VPIRSPRGRAAAYRALWQWPLRSPARLALSVGLLVLVAITVSTGLAALAGPPPAPSPTAGSTTASTSSPERPSTGADRTPTPTALPPVPDLVPTTLPPSSADPAALDVAARWTAAWVRPAEGTTAAQWLEGLRPLTTEEYLGLLATVDPANIPATQVTGAPRPVRVAESSVQAEVPTDAVTLLVLVVRTELGEWRVSGYDEV